VTKAARHTLVVAIVALASRMGLWAWAHARFPPIADGQFYDRFARRLAAGQGYTVAWPDGVVTYAAHYPVGYPAMLALAYRLVHASPGVAMGVNALVGVLGAVAAHRLALRELSPRRALLAGLAMALHPALLLYTPAVMTEGVTASLLLIALACGPGPNESGARKRTRVLRLAAMGAAFGVASLVRPQVIVFAPLLGFVFASGPRWRTRAVAGGVALACALAVIAPWTARNCERMGRCALVSVNGGWNLLIGVETNNGSWAELDVPERCKTVWDEAQKDTCFEHAARAEIAAHPWRWIAKAPRKLAVTFDIFAAGPWYLHQSNASAFDDRAEWRWGAVETLASRLLLALALLAAAPLVPLRRSLPHVRASPALVVRCALGVAGIVFAFVETAWPAYALLGIVCLWRGEGEERSPLRVATGVVVLVTMATHAAFFGAGRYGLLVVPFVTLAALVPFVRPETAPASVVS
jgi:4-amino-4-deoxy-L-arabinose transferase-like glycosyltransferase